MSPKFSDSIRAGRDRGTFPLTGDPVGREQSSATSFGVGDALVLGVRAAPPSSGRAPL
jgi:hypothetical protein